MKSKEGQTLKTKVILVMVLLCGFTGSWQTAWAADKVSLSVDPDIPVGTAGHWYVNLGRNSNYDKVLTLTTDNLAAGQNVFKVYDDGGKNGNYSSGCQSQIVINVPEGYVIQVSGTVWMYYFPESEFLKVSDGKYVDVPSMSPLLAKVYSPSDGEAKDFGPLTTTGNAMCLYFTARSKETTFRGLDLTVTVFENTLYNVSVASGIEHGTVVASSTTAYYNNAITLTVTPAANYYIGTVSYNDGTDHVITPVNEVYSFKMPQQDVTVSATFLNEHEYLWGVGNDGSEQKPYVISNKAGWDLLVTRSQAALVAGNSKYYRLDTDISGVTAGLKNFDGHLDGNHHKITLVDVPGGITTNYASNATFSNLTIEGSVDHDYIFYYPPRLTNCFVNVSRTGDGGFIRLSYYYNYYSTSCAYLLEGIPALFASGENVADLTPANEVVLKAGAFAVRTGGIAIGDGDATLYADGFSYGGTEFFQENATVTLGFDLAGYSLLSYTVSGATLGEDNTFTMPNNGVTVTALNARTDYINHWQASMTIDGSTADKAYVITTTDGLDLLASEVNGGNKFAGTFFRLDADIAYSHSSAWNDISSTENNFDVIGYSNRFGGTFDGGGHTICGIRIYTSSDNVGLFGVISGTVKNIVLADARIIGSDEIGGIVGKNNGTVSGCTVASNVTEYGIIAFQWASHICGGIVGKNNGTVSDCISSVSVTVNSEASGSYLGGIVGINYGTIQNCTAAGVVFGIGTIDEAGAIVGRHNSDGTLSGNTYHSCLVNDDAFNIGSVTMTSATTSVKGDVPGATLDNSKLWLFNGHDNSAIIAAYSAPSEHTAAGGSTPTIGSLTVTMQGRTLYKDGDWSTLCLPFNLNASQVSSLLSPAGLMMLSGSSFQDGTLTLTFENATTIEAGKPYLIKWASGDAIVNPVFTGITVSAASSPVETPYANFIGNYDLFSINEGNKDAVLYVGRGNTIGFSKDDCILNAFGGYFEVKGDALGSTTQVVMDFGDGTNTCSLTARQATFAGQTRYWATFYHSNYNYQLPAGAQAFTMGSDHALYRIGDGSIIPAGCAVVIMADAASLTMTLTGSSATPEDGNILQGVNADTAKVSLVTGTQKVHVMGKSGETFGFFEFSGSTVPANKAYYVE